MNYIDNINIVNDEVNKRIENMKKEYEEDGKRISEYHQKCKDRHGISLANIEFSKENSVCEFNTKMSLACKMCPYGIWMFNSQVLGCFVEFFIKWYGTRRNRQISTYATGCP